MGRNYYYFAASLPMVQWNAEPPVSTEEFRETALRLLSEDDGVLIEKLLIGREDIETDNAAASSWIRFNRNFRNEIAAYRAHQKHKDASKAVRGTQENEPALTETVHAAAKLDDLLEAEKLLDRTSWQKLDELSGGHYYDLEFLICYGLKLKILERHQAYASDAGKDAFEQLRAMDLPIDWQAKGI